MRSKLVLLFVLLTVVAAACGGGTEPLSTSTAVSEPSTVTSIAGQPDGTPIGPDGGTVTSADGLFTVEIPAGALSEIVNIGVEIGSAAAVGVDEAFLAGPVYQLTPDGTVFDAPVVTIRRLSASDLRIADNTVPFFHVFQGLDDGWVPLSTETSREGDQLLVRAETTHFSPNVVVETTEVWGSSPPLELIPATLSAPVGSATDTSWARDSVTGMATLVKTAVPLFSGAVAGHVLAADTLRQGIATCGETPGEGTFGFEVSGILIDAEQSGMDFFLRLFFGVEPQDIPFTVGALGKAMCTKPDTSLIDTVAGVASGQIDFQLHENSPPGSEYTAGFEIDIDANARSVKKTQKPSNQKTEGLIDPATGIYFTFAETDTYIEVYVGGVCPEADGSYYVGGYTFGGPPSTAEFWQAAFDSIPSFDVSVTSPQSISVDPALVPSCEGLDSDPWAFANEIRISFGPDGSIAGAQWDVLFTAEMAVGS